MGLLRVLRRKLCFHSWIYIRKHSRECKKCGECQIYVYNEFGSTRHEWQSCNID